MLLLLSKKAILLCTNGKKNPVEVLANHLRVNDFMIPYPVRGLITPEKNKGISIHRLELNGLSSDP